MKSNHYDRMRKIILTCMILVPAIPFFLAIYIGHFYFTTALERGTLASMQRIVHDHRGMIEAFLQERRADLEFVIQSYAFEVLRQPDTLHMVFTNLQKTSNAFVDIGVFDQEGLHVAYQGPYSLAGKQYGSEPWFLSVMNKGYYISNIFLGFRNVPHFVIALTREENGRQWAIRSTIDPHAFSEIVKNVRIGTTGEAFILDAEGRFQTERRSGGRLMEQDLNGVRYGSWHEGIRTFIASDGAGQTYVNATTWLKENQWLLVVRQNRADAFAALNRAQTLIILITIIGGAAILLTAFFLTDQIVRRLKGVDAEKEQLEEKLIRTHRLAELGEMSAGFAHEINNPLQIVRSEEALMKMNFEEMVEEGILDPEKEGVKEIRDSLTQIKLQLNRCAGITQAILKFGRKTETKVERVDLKAFIPEVVSMVAKKAEVHGMALEQRVAPDTPAINGDSGQLQQVLLNLINNAMDSILDAHGTENGRLEIVVHRWRENRVEIRVTDNGCGITPENQTRIFSPFFTTKPVGKGTGLGLSICYGIIGNMGGVIEIKSEPGKGTSAIVRLPAARSSKAA